MARDFTPLALGVTQAVAICTAMLPPITEVRRNSSNDVSYATEVHASEAVAAAVALSVGAVTAIAVGDAGPLIASASIVGALIVAYEVSLRKPALGNTTGKATTK